MNADLPEPVRPTVSVTEAKRRYQEHACVLGLTWSEQGKVVYCGLCNGRFQRVSGGWRRVRASDESERT